VRDVSPLAKATKLERLSIKRTLIKDLSPLQNLKSLKFLYINGSAVDDTGPLTPLVNKGLRIVRT
jgi:internalin A